MPKYPCAEYGHEVEKLYPDFKIPPLDVGDCLCANCQEAHSEEQIEEYEEEIRTIKRMTINIENPEDG